MPENLKEAPYEGDTFAGTYEQPDEAPEEQEEIEAPEQEERVDWKAQAIEARTRLEMLQKMQQEQHQEPERVDEVASIRQQIEERRSSLPTREEMDKDPKLFWKRDQLLLEMNNLQEKMVEARLRQQEQVLAEQQVGGFVQQYKARFATRPTFKAIEGQFDQMVGQLQPHLRGNQVMLDMIRSKLELDHMERGQGRKKPPNAPDGAYQPPAQPKPNQGKVTWRSEQDRQVGEYYMSRGIISGPEEFYDPKYNERSATANDNGVAIYDIPDRPRGWRR